MHRSRSQPGLCAGVCCAALALPLGLAAQQQAAPVGVPAHGMLEDPFNRAILIDELEGHDGREDAALRWDLNAWAGQSLRKLTIRTEGKRRGGRTERAELQLLWTRSVSRWWEVVGGARSDFAPGPGKNWVAFGVQGLAPYRVQMQATAFVGNGGDTAARFAADYEFLVTSRLILEPQLELDWHGQSDAARGQGAGLASGEVAVRLRYEIRREVAPYVGLVRERRWGDLAKAARLAGEDVDDTSLVAGIRLRF